ncbi:MAG: hypothetical protein ACQEXQ_16030 [Bacillota bacterium]
MISISEKLETILKVIPFGEGVKYGEIQRLLDVKNGYLVGSLQWLVDKGLVNKEGVTRQYRYSRADVEFVVVCDRELKEASEELDTLMEQLTAFKVSDKQRQFLQQNKHLPRRELARKLGIGKLEVNQALLQMGIGQK